MAEVVNYYEELALDRGASTSEIRTRLQRAKLEYMAKARRGSGSMLNEFKRKLELADQAEHAFKDDDARDRYDIALRRADAPDVRPMIDWVGKTWSYYFNGDNGAALIAARKAKEQAPDQPMAYIVSAWVWLGEGEPKQAKGDADEAFVLGEHTSDIVDVLEVRGAVFRALGERERAVASFDRALVQAADAAKPELYLRKAQVHDELRQFENCFEAARDGLSQHVQISDDVRRGLESLVMNAINSGVPRASPEQAIKYYSEYSRRIGSIAFDMNVKLKMLANVRDNIERCERQIALTKESRDLQRRCEELRNGSRGPRGTEPDFPAFTLRFTAVVVVLGFIFAGLSHGKGVVNVVANTSFVIAAISGLFALAVIIRQISWRSARRQNVSMEKRVRQILDEKSVVDHEISSLDRPILLHV